MRGLLPAVALLVAAAALPVRSTEEPVALKDAPGHETVESKCGVCHSLDYIRMNSPFMTPKTWQAEVNKMIDTFGAPIDAPDAEAILDYLTKNYGPPG